MEDFSNSKGESTLSRSPLQEEWLAGAGENTESELDKLDFDYLLQGRHLVILAIRMPDGGKISRVTEPLKGRDGEEGGYRILKGYKLPDGSLLEKDIRRNSDGSISLVDIDVENRKPDKQVLRMSQDEFIKFVKERSKK